MKARRFHTLVGLLAALFTLAASDLLAQSAAQLGGRVTDPSKAVVAGARIGVVNVATGIRRDTSSNNEGYYAVPQLQPGTYRVEVQMSGFRPLVLEGIVIETGLAKTLDVELQVGGISETVQVEARAPLLEAENATLGQFIERTTVNSMPIDSRRTGSLVRLLGMVAFTEEWDSEQIPRFSMAGGRTHAQTWQLDGAIVNNTALDWNQLSLNPSAESMQEFKAESSNYSAEFGNAGGGVITMTTRSGTNQFRGALYEYLRNDKLDTRTFFAAQKPQLRYNIFGASLGGPIRANKTFFFANYEGSRRRTPQVFSGTIVPHPPEVDGDFSARRDLTVLDPTTRTAFPGNRIPTSRFDPLGRAYAKMYPAPNVAGNDITRIPAANYIASGADGLRQDYTTVRIDHLLGAKDTLNWRLTNGQGWNTFAPVFPDPVTDSRTKVQRHKHTNTVGSWVRVFSPALTNEARYTYGKRYFRAIYAGVGSNKNKELGIAGVDPSGFASVGATGLSGFGAGGVGGSEQERIQSPIMNQEFIDNLTWMRGRHQVKTGFDFRYLKNGEDNRRLKGGRFDFSDRATNNGIATLLLGWTTSAELAVADLIQTRMNYWGWYVQDNWKVTAKLTLNLGVRWEMSTPRWEMNNRQSGFDFRAMNPVSGTPGIMTFAGVSAGQYAHDFDKNNYGPRFGFAYRLSGRTVVRGGYGISYAEPYFSSTGNALTSGFGLFGTFTSPDGGFTPAFLFRSGMPTVAREQRGPGFGAVPVGQTPRLTPDYYQSDHEQGYSQQFNLTIQRELPGDLMAEAAYVGNLGHKLPMPDINMNMVPLVNGRGPATQDQRQRPFPQYGNVTQRSPSWGNSTYHATNVKIEKRYSHGMNLLANYTWSKFLDNSSDRSTTGRPAGFQHLELRHLDKALAGSDMRHRFMASGVYEPPFGRGRKRDIRHPVLNAIAGGWGVGVIAELRTGSPFGVTEQTNRSNTFSASQRSSVLRNPEITGSRPRGEVLALYFDTAAFAAPAAGAFGNAGRVVGTGPGKVGIDISVNKRWAMRERFGLQFRGDIYNLPNRPNFGPPNTSRGSGTFGRVTATQIGSTGRQIQLSLRLEF